MTLLGDGLVAHLGRVNQRIPGRRRACIAWVLRRSVTIPSSDYSGGKAALHVTVWPISLWAILVLSD